LLKFLTLRFARSRYEALKRHLVEYANGLLR
jgi:hypothetical protein